MKTHMKTHFCTTMHVQVMFIMGLNLSLMLLFILEIDKEQQGGWQKVVIFSIV